MSGRSASIITEVSREMCRFLPIASGSVSEGVT
jgi:hypothetical protein